MAAISSWYVMKVYVLRMCSKLCGTSAHVGEVSGWPSHGLVRLDVGGRVGADQAFCLVRLGWYLSDGSGSFVCLVDRFVYVGLEFGDSCWVVDLMDLDLVGELADW